MRALVMVLVVAFCAGCLPKIPRQRLSERAKVAVAYIVDPGYSGTPFTPPDALKKAIAAELDDHNLELVEVPLEAVSAQRLTDSRFDALKKAAGEVPFVLLVEQRVHFFSQLDGRYRWEVATTLTASRADGAKASDPFEIPVILMYDHEKEREAIANAASDIANRVGVLMDGVLAGAAGTAVPAAAPKASSTRPSGIYFVMVDRFSNGDRRNDGDAAPEDSQAFHGGDLQGLIDHLDWIQALGFDTVWLSPIFKMRTEKWHGYGAFHGYWTWDLAQLEPKFGDELLLARLRSELDRRKMKLMLDVVLNHVGPDAPLVSAKPHWFHKRGGVTDWNDATQLLMNDVHGLSDLATEQDEVFAYLLGAARRWVPGRQT
ncbi:MAG: alpha-amylase family glycosyl hydrolase [Archangium sp.]|nr:alpha-amylase family glycosyl hydrolase [Archangium sp.]